MSRRDAADEDRRRPAPDRARRRRPHAGGRVWRLGRIAYPVFVALAAAGIVMHGRVAGQAADAAGTAPDPALSAVAAQAPIPTNSPKSRAAASADPLDALTAGLSPGSFSVAALDLTTGARYQSGATSGMPSASVAKLLLLEAYLLQHQYDGSRSADIDDCLALMIEHSDNDAAETIYDAIGQVDGLQHAIRELGLTGTNTDPDGEWGLADTSAGDQLMLLRDLATATSPLTTASRKYALSLMQQVQDDQRWGVPAASDAGTITANKNGWLPVSDDGDRWLVNSDGIVTYHGHRLLLAVLTQHNPDMETGIALVEQLAQQAAAHVDP